MARRQERDLRPLLIVTGAVFLAVVVGVSLAVKTTIGIALLLVAGYALILYFAPVWALVGFVPLIFLEALPALNSGGKAAGLLVAVFWVGALLTRRDELSQRIRRRRRLFEALVSLLLWLALTAVWAADPSRVISDLWHWVSVGLLFTIVATWLREPKVFIWFCGAFVLGAVLAVAVGAGAGAFSSGAAAAAESRLEGGVGDPNFLAAGLVPAIVLAGGLMVAARTPIARLACGVAILACTLGVAATQSHGGILALCAAGFASLFVFRRRRVFVVVACLGVVALAAAYFSVNPGAWNRISTIEDGGSGRSDLWSIAWQITEDHPVAGVGLKNYQVVAKDYTRKPGELTAVNKIAEQPHYVHNTYLEFLAETGVVGLSLFLCLALGSVYTAWQAGKRFEELEEPRLEAVARALVVAMIAMLVAATFISDGVDQRLWVLLGLGPAALGLAESRSRYSTP